MMKILRLTAILFISFLFVSCQKHVDSTPPTPVTITYDADAQKFFDGTGISDTLQKGAINTLVKQLKDSALWGQFMAIYPVVGGTSASTMLNLKDPRNLDQAYRLTYHGTPVFAASGVLFPTVNDYADSHLTDSAIGSYNNAAISYYSVTQNTVDGYDMGCGDNTPPYNEFAIYHSTDATNWFGYYAYGVTPVSTIGLFILSSTSNDVKRYENGIVSDSKGAAPTPGYTNYPILLGAVKSAPAVGQRECAFASIGKGLSDAQALTFYNVVMKFIKRLSR